MSFSMNFNLFALLSFFVFPCTLSQQDSQDSVDVDSGRGGRDRIVLTQDMFTDGTVRITDSNVLLIFGEDIVFDPNSDYETSPNEEGAYFPRDNDLYPGSDGTRGSFRLGFFAGLSLEGDNIELNLNGYTFSVSPEFQIQQRFFTLIGVGKGPFISGEGPTDFGDNIEVNNIHIHNGILGLSPHHGIHGNFINNIEINNIIFKDFELAGIHLNGFNNAHIHNVEIGPAFTNIPVMGRYTQARDGILSFRQMKERIESLDLSDNELNEQYSIEFVAPNSDETRNVIEIVDRLLNGMDMIFDYKSTGNIPTNSDDLELFIEAYLLFNNDNGLADGGAQYGIVLNSAGVAVNWFGSQTTDYSTDAIVSDVYIHDLNGNPTEVVVYAREDSEHVTGPFKSVLSMNLLLDLDKFDDPKTFDLATDSIDNYNGNILSDAQIALAIYGTDEEKHASTIDNEFIEWSLGSSPLEDGKLVCNGDAQFHMIKGLVGIRVDRVNNLLLNDIIINNVTNHGGLGSNFCNSYDGDSIDISGYSAHSQTPQTNENWKYQGRVARGIALTDVTGDIELDDISISGIVSKHGSAIAIDLIGSASVTVNLDGDIEIENIKSGTNIHPDDEDYYTSDAGFPNYQLLACSLHDEFNDNASYDDDNIDDLDINDMQGLDYCDYDDDQSDDSSDSSDSSEDGDNNGGGGGNGGRPPRGPR